MRSTFKKGRRSAALALSVCASLAAPPAMAATYYGPPYTVQSFRGVGTFESVGAGVGFLTEKIQAPCRQNPNCTTPPKVTVSYGPNNHWAAAIIYVDGTRTDTVNASEISIGQPEKNFGGCQQRCTAGLGGENDGTGARGTAKSAASANAASPGSPFEGDPINTSSGNFYRQETDFDASSALTFRRFYNSSPRAPGSALGPQWRHSFERRLEILASAPEISGAGTFMRVMRPDGASELFTRKNGVWSADADVADIIVELPAGAGYALQLAANRQTEIYDASGRLKQVHDPSGQRILTLEYSTALTPLDIAPAAGLLLSVTDQRARSLKFTYDSASRLSKMTLPDNSMHSFGYNAGGYLVSATYPDGSSKGYIYNEQINTSSSDRPGFLTGITDEKGKRYETVRYLASNRAYYTEFAGGVDATTLDYATLTSNGTLPVTVKSTLGVQTLLKFTDTGKGRLLPAGGNAACGSQCNQPYKSMTYDTNGYPASTTDFKGNITRTIYSPDGLLTQQIDGAGSPQQRTTIIGWDSVLRAPKSNTVLDANGVEVAKSTWSYNASGQETARCEVDSSVAAAADYACGSGAVGPAGVRQTTTAYCVAKDETRCPEIGLVLEQDGPRTDVNDKVVFSYYLTTDASGCATIGGNCHQAGDLYQVTNAIGQATTFLAYDRNGRVTRIRGIDGTITDTTYTPRGWPSSSVLRARADGAPSSDDQSLSVEYDAVGNIAKTIDQDGVHLTYQYDDAHRLVGIRDAAGNSTTYTLDTAGNRLKEEVRDQAGVVKLAMSRTFNKLGQMTAVANSKGEATDHSYDVNGNIQVITDALKRKTQVDYDALDRVTRTIQDVGGLSVETMFQYDAVGRTTRTVDPKGLHTSYLYDAFGGLKQLSSPDTGVSTFTFNIAGKRVSRTDARGMVTNYSYDALNRLVSKTYAGSPSPTTYTYDVVQEVCQVGEQHAIGRISAVLDGAGKTQYCYNRAGQVARKVQTVGAVALNVAYEYSKAGRLTRIVHPNGSATDYQYNALGQVLAVGVTPVGGARELLLNSATFYPFGPSAGWSYGNGRTMNRGLDLDYRPLVIETSGVGGLSASYTYNSVGDLTGINAPSSGTIATSFTYDALHRLTAFKDALTGTSIESYTYDATGNRLTTQSSAGIQQYTYPLGTHRVSSVNGVPRTYDESGNTLSIDGTDREFGYDHAGRLASTSSDGAVVKEYRYNQRGEQVIRFNAQSAEYSLHDEYGQWIGDYDAAGNPLQQAIWLEGMPVGVIANGVLHYVEPDQLGTPRAVLESTRDAVVWRWDIKSEAFGDSIPEQDPDLDGVDFRFDLRHPGQRFDEASGTSQNVYRDYDPSTGRYLQSDPIGLSGGVSTYGYAGQSPLTNADPLGLDYLVVAGSRREGGVNILGHVGFGASRNGMYSYGNDTPLRSSVREYLKSQGRLRDQYVTLLPSTQNSTDAVASYMNSFHPDLNGVGIIDNCAVRVSTGLRYGGIKISPSILPGSVILDASGQEGAKSWFLKQGEPLPKELDDLLLEFDAR